VFGEGKFHIVSWQPGGLHREKKPLDHLCDALARSGTYRVTVIRVFMPLALEDECEVPYIGTLVGTHYSRAREAECQRNGIWCNADCLDRVQDLPAVQADFTIQVSSDSPIAQ
jgi:hypothetical protein